MLTTTAYHMDSEITYRQDRIAQDWRAVRNRGAGRRSLRSSLRLTRRSTPRLPERRLGGATLA
jgi:hypothetical protein